jgi:hypothetical protein
MRAADAEVRELDVAIKESDAGLLVVVVETVA